MAGCGDRCSADARRDRLVTEYNVRFNSLRPARYDGADLALPGQAGLNPHPHQRDAVARIINEPTVLLDHVVGAGKTGVMFMGAMELRRLGLARQPWIVVPNHLIEQVGCEAKQWYPGAKVLIAANTEPRTPPSLRRPVRHVGLGAAATQVSNQRFRRGVGEPTQPSHDFPIPVQVS